MGPDLLATMDAEHDAMAQALAATRAAMADLVRTPQREQADSALTKTVPGPVLTIVTGSFGRGYKKNVASVWR